MKAVVLEGVRSLQVREIPAPEMDGYHVIFLIHED